MKIVKSLAVSLIAVVVASGVVSAKQLVPASDYFQKVEDGRQAGPVVSGEGASDANASQSFGYPAPVKAGIVAASRTTIHQEESRTLDAIAKGTFGKGRQPAGYTGDHGLVPASGSF